MSSGPPAGSAHRESRRALVAVVAAVVVVTTAVLLVAATRGHSARNGLTFNPLGPPVANAALPPFTHAYVIVLENKGPGLVTGQGQAPYLSSLARRFGIAMQYQAVAHPSQPNYIAMVSGDTQGIADDQSHDIKGAPTLFDQLEAHGHSWRVYAENYPGDCFTGEYASGGPDGAGEYARKHNPAMSFTSISGDPKRCANIQPLSSFDPAAADYELIVPNMCHDMHDCSVAVGDKWLSSFVPKILDSAAWRSGGALFITFDESDSSGNSNRVLTLVASPATSAGFRSASAHSHYSLLRTIEDSWQLGCLAGSCSAQAMAEFFRPPAAGAPPG